MKFIRIIEMKCFFNEDEIEVRFVNEVPRKALSILLMEGKTYADISAEWGNNEDIATAILKPVAGYNGLKKEQQDRFFSDRYKDKESKEFYITTQWGKTSTALPRWNQFINGCKQLGLDITEVQEDKNIGSSELNQILYGPPGTGKTYSTVQLALDILDRKGSDSKITSIQQLKDEFPKRVEFVTFHQSFSYEDFVEGLKAKSEEGKLSYSIEGGIFYQICKNAKTSGNNSLDELDKAIERLKEQVEEGSLELKTGAQKKEFSLTYNGGNSFYAKPDAGTYDNPVSIESIRKLYINSSIKSGEEGVHFKTYTMPVIAYLKERFAVPSYQEQVDNKPHVLIIDEINRGNISRIFGELITLIETSKRTGSGTTEGISVTLPYSKESFSVPKNLYIIGTMNTADRSLDVMDTALRRRFDFIEMMPDTEIMRKVMGSTMIDEGIDLVKLLNKVNQRIEMLSDREHTIGHAFFLEVSSLTDLRHVFKNKILPLLEEYFYDDWERIRLVLADKNQNFYEVLKNNKDMFLGMENDYGGQKKYKRKNEEYSKEAFIQIYEPTVVTNDVDEGE